MAKQRYAFDEALLSAFHLAQQRKQEQNQFKQKMAFEMRQLNLLDAFRQKDYDLRNKGFLADQINAGRDLEGKRLKAQDDYTPFNTLQDVPENIRNNAFSGSEYPSLLGGDKFYVPNTEIPKEDTSKLEGSYKNSDTKTYWKYDPIKREGVDTGIPYDPTEGKTTVNMNMPKPDKWKKFGKLITGIENKYGFDSEGKPVEKSEEQRNLQRAEGKNELQTTLLPNAYSFFEKHLDGNYSDEYYFKRIKKGLEDDELTEEDVQDLIDASAYRKRIYGIK